MRRLGMIVFVLLVAKAGFAEPSPPASTEGLGDEAYGVLASIFSYDVGYPLNARIAGTVEQEGVNYEKVVFQSFHNGAVPAVLAIPGEGEGPYPVVLLLHGLTDSKSAWMEAEGFTSGGKITQGLLKNGYAVMALDAQYHGERAVYNDYINPGEMVFKHGWGKRYSDMVAQTIVDYRRAIDYLVTRKEFDTNRIGIVGYSMGGHMSFILAAVDPRIKAVVGCVIPEMKGSVIAASTFAGHLEKVDLLMMMAKKDQLYTVDSAQALFNRVATKEKQIRLFDSGHSLPVEYTGQVVEWLSQNL